MKQPITGYHKDAEDHWVAELACGHGQHVRHDPPWMERPWVTTEEGRNNHLGVELNCVRCDEAGLKVATALLEECRKTLIESYESAGISGLCDEGQFESAVGSIQTLDLNKIVAKALSTTKG
ncbi:DUF3565 domain-containing protein [Bdellovibrio sp. HCB337]|uniref:DUF3565 domain-containing protein n=1 Tax=Bdellovibrio sp. HCB337 TaxID=3394358 RepID=UPI0039A4ADBB